MDKTIFGISVLIGASVGKQYFSAFDNAEQRATKLGSALEATNRKLASAREAAKYKSTLESLRNKQQALGGTSQRLSQGIAEVEKRYKRAKQEAKSYGIEVGKLAREQRRLGRESAALERRLGRLHKAGLAKERLGNIRGRALGALGLTYGGARVVGSAMQLEQAQVRLGTVLNSDNKAADLAAAKSFALEYDRNNMADATEILDIQYALPALGWMQKPPGLAALLSTRWPLSPTAQKKALAKWWQPYSTTWVVK